jgi:hypothetical protein
MPAMTQTATDPGPFPPDSIEAFLRFCAGEWMSLRSRFALEDPAAASADVEAAAGDEWHSSERGELMVTYLEPEAGGEPGGLSVGPKGEPPRRLHFTADGGFRAGDQRGSWQLWPDGSLELTLTAGERELRERIWFTKPNLRLRSTLESAADGSPSRASFCSEIRRVSRPAAAAA